MKNIKESIDNIFNYENFKYYFRSKLSNISIIFLCIRLYNNSTLDFKPKFEPNQFKLSEKYKDRVSNAYTRFRSNLEKILNKRKTYNKHKSCEDERANSSSKTYSWNKSLKWKTAKFHKNFQFQSKISKMNELNLKLGSFIGSKIRRK